MLGHAECNKSFLCAQPWAGRGYGPGEDSYRVSAWGNPQPSGTGRPGPVLQIGALMGAGKGRYGSTEEAGTQTSTGVKEGFQLG